MASDAPYESPLMREKIYQLFREFFARAERRRRWSLETDIPWGQCNPALNPAVADVVESFCAVELYLPDYLSNMIPLVRASHGRAWFAANWGYEESKHSMALGDWLLYSKQRTQEQMFDLDRRVFAHDWKLPVDSVQGMVCYGVIQELATWLNYRNLRHAVGEAGDPALYKLLGLIMVDERAHYSFFRDVLRLHLDFDRAGTLEQMRRVIHSFAMPGLALMADGINRKQAVMDLGLFDDTIFYSDVYLPILADLGIDRQEMRRRDRREFAQVEAPKGKHETKSERQEHAAVTQSSQQE
jgi:acyl-[acyl-carrier-protein] desaturase